MRRTRIAVAALAVVATSVIGLAPAAHAQRKSDAVEICTGPIDELDEHAQPTGYFYINCSGTYYRYKY
jgi:hypothetical protein